MSAFSRTTYTKKTGSTLNQSQKVKPFCKVCFDTGKSETMYNSHFVRETRDINSRVVCPTLLALQCRFCGNGGHTVSKCKKAAAAAAASGPMAPMKASADLQKKISHAIAAKSVKKNLANVFDCLSDDDDAIFDISDDISEATTSVESSMETDSLFPMLSAMSRAECIPCKLPLSGMSYANALLREHEVDLVKQLSIDTYYDCSMTVSTSSTCITDMAMRKNKFSKSWADDSDSDDE